MTFTGKARVAGIFGWPVSHSRSPQLHGYWLNQYKIDGVYIPFPVPPEAFPRALQALSLMGFVGANVTLPHKERALEFMDEVDETAEKIGAVNTVTVRDGRLHGTNTDAYGFIENLRAGAPTWLGNRPAVVFGAGGTARAVVVALCEAGVPQIRLVNRTVRRAEDLAKAIGGTIQVIPWENRSEVLADADLVVNTTTLGMIGRPDLDIELGALASSCIVTDVVYNPLETSLLAAAKARGLTVVDGIGMLLHQARPGFATWFGVKPDVTEAVRQAVVSDAQGL